MEHSLTVTYGEAWCCANPTQEARSLLPLLRKADQTVADVLELIRVAPDEERLLREFAQKFPELKLNVERSLDYRLRVEKEFCRLAGDAGALPADDPMPGAPMCNAAIWTADPERRRSLFLTR